MKPSFSFTLLSVLGLQLASTNLLSRELSVHDLFDSKHFRDFTLSPDGAYVAFIGENANGVMALFAQDLETGEVQSWMGGGYEPMVGSYFWISSTRLAYEATNDQGYDGLYVVERDSLKIKKLTTDRNRLHLMDPLISQDSFLTARVLGNSSARGGILFGFSRIFTEKEDQGVARLVEIEPIKGKVVRSHDLYNVLPGSIIRAEDPRPSLFVNSEGNIRVLAVNQRDNNSRSIFNSSFGHLTVLGKQEWISRPSEESEPKAMGNLEDFRVLGLDPSGRMALISGYFGEDLAGVYRYDLIENVVGSKIYGDPHYDLRDSVTLAADVLGRPLGLRYRPDRPRTIWFSTDLQQVQETIDQRIPNASNTIVAADTSRGRFLINSQSDRQPRQIRLLDLEKRSLTMIFESNPVIKPEDTATTESLQIEAPDGRLLRGYLTRPNGVEAPYPTVVLLRNTPRHRSTWGFDPLAQFFASRGYAVLQVETRGSPGYGNHFSNGLLGDIEGGQQDIADAVAWTTANGMVDPERVAVVGHLFHGGTVIQLVDRFPKLFRCAISIDGFFDLEEYVFSRMPQADAAEAEFIKGLLVFYGDDLNERLQEVKAHLESLSPLKHTNRIESPILVVYDPRPSSRLGSTRDAKQMIAALERKNAPVESFESTIPFGSWYKAADPKDQAKATADFEALYSRIEAFLAEML